jgi:peptidoglycan/LPS O-acetylase OafA/YrhL
MRKLNNNEGRLNLDLISKYRNELFGLAIISIMVFHFFNHFSSERLDGNGFAKFYMYGISSIGVDIFLFLSGMGLIFSMSKNSDLGQFYSKRLIRVVVPYAVWGTVFWIMSDMLAQGKGILQFLYDFSFLSFWIDGNTSLWYVGFIIIVYLAFPFLFKFLNSERSFPRLVLLIAISCALNYALFFFAPEEYDNIEIAIGRIPIFLIGTYIGKRIYNHEPFKKCDLALFLVGLIVQTFEILKRYGVIEYDFEIRRYAMGLFSISLIFIFVWLLSKIKVKFIHTFLQNVGGLSFELYMTHVTVDSVMRDCGLPTYRLRYYLICIILSIIFSLLLHNALKGVNFNIFNRQNPKYSQKHLS